MLLKIMLTTLMTASFVAAQQPVKPSTAALSPVPLWPQDGDTSRLPKGQYVFYDPPAGEYVISYAVDAGNMQSSQPTLLRFGTHNLIDPEVSFTAASGSNESFHYTYGVANGARARQSIQKVGIIVYFDGNPRAWHASWISSLGTGPLHDLATSNVTTATINWEPNTAAQSIAPGTIVTDFVVDSTSLPGFTTMIFRGASQSNEYSAEAVASLPNEVRDQAARVFKAPWDRMTRLVIGPKFSKGVSQSTIAQNFLFGLQSLIRERKLDSNSPFVKSAIGLLSAQLESGGTALINPVDIAFDKAKPGLEATIAHALQATLTQ